MLNRIDLLDEARERRDRLFSLAGSATEYIIATSPENILYVTGFWSMALDTDRVHPMAAIVSRDSLQLVCPAADFGPAMEIIREPSAFFLYGTFHLDVGDGFGDIAPPETRFGTFSEALQAAVGSKPARGRRFLVDRSEAATATDTLDQTFPDDRFGDAAMLFRRARAVKIPSEIERLRIASMTAEAGILAGFTNVRRGMSEREVAATITAEIVRRGAVPGFVVVTSGPRAALCDAYPTARTIDEGDLIRVDVGCTSDGYWADTARTATMGEPTLRNRDLYRMTSAGELAQLDRISAGLRAADAYQVAVDAVRSAGLPQYRRHHCGHGLGLECFEFPALRPDNHELLEEGMVLCVETPFYELGIGGMMIEDTLVVGREGITLLTQLDRKLWIVG